MPKSCVIIGCNSSARHRERKFFRFPLLLTNSAKNLATTQTRQTAWLRAINRSDFFPESFKSANVCDLHFVSGICVVSNLPLMHAVIRLYLYLCRQGRDLQRN